MFRIDSKLELMPAVSKTIARLNRDIRFSKDKSLYRDTMWLTFTRRTKERNDYSAFFFEINPIIEDIDKNGIFAAEEKSYKKSRYNGNSEQAAG